MTSSYSSVDGVTSFTALRSLPLLLCFSIFQFLVAHTLFKPSLIHLVGSRQVNTALHVYRYEYNH